ncbi:MAG: glycosyltransferase family 1 protein [Clostridium sp.]|uniref:glycosyltransferase family 1 protein n=1 Tax=Clostridium sp. TaxID=1506 RepID=UPI0029111FAD|nr:glycosyltransferase family 1 protein [Clostridium sp.]
MKRIICIVDSMNTGGAETFLMKLYRAIDRSKYQIDFIVSDKGFYDDEIAQMGGIVNYIPLRTKHPYIAFKRIKEIIKAGNYKSVLKFGSTPIVALDLLAAKKGGAIYLGVRSCNSFAEESFIYKAMNTICKPLFNRIVNLKIAPSDLAACFTFGEKSYSNGEVNILHNAVDLNYFKFSEIKRSKIRNELDLDDKFNIYGHIGRFSKQKNHEYLIEIFKYIHEMDPYSKLVLVGTGELKSEIERKVDDYNLTDSVIFLGVRKDIPDILSAIDLFVFPSFFEGMPNTVVEAQAVGLPCIVSDTITRQANITGVVSYMSINDNAESWARECFNHPKERKETTAQFIKSGYNIDYIVKEFVDIMVGDNCEK